MQLKSRRDYAISTSVIGRHADFGDAMSTEFRIEATKPSLVADID
jgi:hypothetical protein